MNIYNAISELNKLVPDVGKFVSLWKIEQTSLMITPASLMQRV